MEDKMEYLLQIAIGPVQDFIAAARRTRDLWVGSTMLSEISKAAAKAVNDSGGKLIFPNPENAAADLKDGSPFNVANIILAEVRDAAQAKEAADKAREAARGWLIERGERVRGIGGLRDLIVNSRWQHQLCDIIEVYSAWVPIGSDYKRARKAAGRLIAARKNIRDFARAKCSDAVDKSSLDGLRESVFCGPKGLLPDADMNKLPDNVRIKSNEALDAIGLIKRVPLKADQTFPSVSRVAVDPWVRSCDPDMLKDIEEDCRELVRLGALSRVSSRIDTDSDGDAEKKLPSIKSADIFPYEGTALLADRHSAMIRELPKSKQPEAEDACGRIAEKLARNTPQEPYLAFICADGDKMGAALSAMDSAEAHRTFSKTLAGFAGKAREIVNDHYGVCVYTGGDDVLAFLPLDTAMKCARDLREKFVELMGQFKDKNGNSPTLSVGVSIAHAMEDLELLLQWARDAEKLAKGTEEDKKKTRDRDGLAVYVRARGNAEMSVREQWGDRQSGTCFESMKGSLDARLQWWSGMFASNRIPNKFPYELRTNAEFYEDWTDGDDLHNAVREDITRIFDRKDIDLGTDEDALRNYIRKTVTDAAGIKRLADEMMIAQWLSMCSYGRGRSIC